MHPAMVCYHHCMVCWPTTTQTQRQTTSKDCIVAATLKAKEKSKLQQELIFHNNKLGLFIRNIKYLYTFTTYVVDATQNGGGFYLQQAGAILLIKKTAVPVFVIYYECFFSQCMQIIAQFKYTNIRFPVFALFPNYFQFHQHFLNKSHN